MPAIPVISGALVSIGVSVAVASAVATVATYAVAGAVIGGLGAAVMGGDIGKGVLYGAIGGAVMGGFSAYSSWGATTAGAAEAAGTSTSQIASPALMEASANSGVALGSTAETIVPAGGGGFMASLGEGTAPALIDTGGKMLIGAFDDSAERTEALERDKMKQQNEQFYAELEATKEMSKSGGGSSSDAAKYSADLQLLNAREQRQADWKLKNKEFSLIDEQRARRRGALTGLNVVNAPSGNTTTPSVQQQVYDESKAMYGEEQNPAESAGLLFGNK